MRLLICLAICSLSALARAQAPVTITSGAYPRAAAIVQFRTDAAPGDYQLVTDTGQRFATTVDATSLASAIVSMPAGTTWHAHLEKAPGAAADTIVADRSGGIVDFREGRRALLHYQGEMSPLPRGYDPLFQRGGYLHPVYTPAGRMVTDDYPANHKHHHGIWDPWTKTEFEGRHPDFWNMGDGTGKVEFVSLGDTWSGQACAGLVTHQRFVDLSAKPKPKAALNETWIVRVYPTRSGDVPVNIFDLETVQTCAGKSPLALPLYRYGGMGYRGPMAWNGKGKLNVLTSEGKDVSNANESRARWFRASGMLDGKPACIVVLCHPANFRFPQPLRVHPTEPFICWAPPQLGAFEITPIHPYVARYRYITADAELSRDAIEELWIDYAHPVEARQ